MTGRLSGHTAIVTGASQGIGRAIAVAFGREGANIVATARTTEAIEAVAKQVRELGPDAIAVTADLGTDSGIQRIVDETAAHFGHADILVNNAAIIHPRIPLIEMDPAMWRAVLDVNITGAALLTRAVLPGMIEGHYGKIINISSIGGRKGGRGRSAYRVSKAALISLTETLAAEAWEHGISVNCICPSATDTEGYRKAFNSRGRDENPRMMLPGEIAEVALFLASAASSAITGAAIDAFGSSNPLFA